MRAAIITLFTYSGLDMFDFSKSDARLTRERAQSIGHIAPSTLTTTRMSEAVVPFLDA